MGSAIMEGRPTVFNPQQRFAQFLGDAAHNRSFTRQQRNDFMLGLVHEAVHLRNPAVPSPAASTAKERLEEEMRAWKTVSLGVVRPLRRLGEPMHSTFVRVDDALQACNDRPDCQPLTQAMVPVPTPLTP